jgi:isoleucyl-tRNA synthetase
MKKFEEFRDVDYPALEEAVLGWWEENNIFERSVTQHENAPTFTFYEGPPTANGQPGIHHVLARTIKDAFCRYKTMKGYRVERKAGWDTHGLPVEIEVEKALGLEGRHQVEEYGIERYNCACRESVLKYKGLWDRLTTRMGYWVDQDDPYITFKPRYIESVWWLLKTIYEKGFLYEGHKIQWYSPGSGTVLSSHEVSLGYKEVQDPSVYVRFRITSEENAFFLAWTTTPWTLISNTALAVGPGVEYVKIRTVRQDASEVLYLAANRLSVIDSEYEILETIPGQALSGMRYEPLFDYFIEDVGLKNAWYVVTADYVSTEDGTGIVHTAPAFGAEDYDTARRENLPIINPMKRDGHFDGTAGIVANLWFKDADKVVHRDLRDRGLLYRLESYVHNYPHDWRKGTPLMSYPVKSWFIRTTAIKERLIELNEQINWQPEGIGTGRFGDWLKNNVDWALSRKRFWGTPLPIWRSDVEGSEYMEIIGSIEELRSKCPGVLPADDDDVDLHRPFVDDLTWASPDGGTMRRVEDLIDVWFDSGAMPFAQWHYPFENKDLFERTFPADFIAEGVDQTRGWFYTLHAIAALVMDDLAYRNVVVNGLVLDSKGEKMSKSKGNSVDPFELIESHGIDVVRWYLMSNSPPWENLKFSERGLVETKRKFFNTLMNSYAFFATYANIDLYTGEDPKTDPADRPEMDRWILSRLQSTVLSCDEALDSYNPTKAARSIERFVDELSNWYIRRNRRRFWSAKDGAGDGNDDAQKTSAYDTVSECLITVAKLMSPIAPFISETLFGALSGVLEDAAPCSVHLASYPDRNTSHFQIDEALEHRMFLARTISSCVLGLRNTAGINVRQPLKRIVVVTGVGVESEVIAQIESIIQDEVNIRAVEYISGSSDIVHHEAKANFKVLGRRLGKLMKPVSLAITQLTDAELDSYQSAGTVTIEVEGQKVDLVAGDIDIVSKGIEGWLVGQESGVTVALDTVISDDLRAEGLARETVNRIQNMRKSADYDVSDRILVGIHGSQDILEAIRRHRQWIRNETLSLELEFAPVPDGDLVSSFDIDSEQLTIGVRRVS